MKRLMLALSAGLLLSACGGAAAPAASPSAPAPAASSPAAKPAASAAAPASTAASAKPATSVAASAKPAASGAASATASAKPAASGSAAASPAPSLPAIPKVTLQLAKPLPALNPAVTVKARVGTSLTTAPFWYAIEKGYFDQLGLKFEEVQITQSADVTGPLTQGQIDIAGTAFSPGLYNAIARGVDAQAVADNGQLQPNLAGSAVVVKKGQLASYGSDWCALKGKKIVGVAKVDGFYATLLKALQSCNLQESDVDATNPGFAAVNTALVNGSADVGFNVEPFVSQGVQQGLIEIWHQADVAWPNQQMNMLLYGPQFLKNTDAALRFMVAYMAGVRDYDRDIAPGGDQNELGIILAEHLPVKDPSAYGKMIMMGITHNGAVNTQALSEEVQLFQKSGTIQPGQVNLGWVTNDIRDQALMYLGG
ncbi:MAG: ABC transporter substrate-binding protein [Chloroflexi bacterium]|nr:ABC transporter substrate-binding protein [Chloroflexota bacterium]